MPGLKSFFRRFRAQFFVTHLPVASALSGPSSGSHIHRLPSPDSPDRDDSTSTEVVSARFVHPHDLLSEFSRGEIGLLPPQFYILSTLLDVFGTGSDSGTNTPAHRQQVQKISRSTFGRREFSPRLDPQASSDRERVLVLEGDETRGGKKGHLHRVILPQENAPVSRTIMVLHDLCLTRPLSCLVICDSSEILISLRIQEG